MTFYQNVMSYASEVRLRSVLIAIFAIYLLANLISLHLRRQSQRHHENRITNSRTAFSLEEKLSLFSLEESMKSFK